jgi:hypothetical protein
MLKSSRVRSTKESARREGVDDSYVRRMANLTIPAPDIVAAILDETLSPEVTLFEPGGAALGWREQGRRIVGGSALGF